MLISTRLPEGPSSLAAAERRGLLAELLGAHLGTVLFHAAASLDELDHTEAAVARLVDALGDDAVGLTLDIGGGVAVIEVQVRGGGAPSGLRSGPTTLLGPARQSVAEQIETWLATHGQGSATNLRLVIDAP